MIATVFLSILLKRAIKTATIDIKCENDVFKKNGRDRQNYAIWKWIDGQVRMMADTADCFLWDWKHFHEKVSLSLSLPSHLDFSSRPIPSASMNMKLYQMCVCGFTSSYSFNIKKKTFKCKWWKMKWNPIRELKLNRKMYDTLNIINSPKSLRIKWTINWLFHDRFSVESNYIQWWTTRIFQTDPFPPNVSTFIHFAFQNEYIFYTDYWMWWKIASCQVCFFELRVLNEFFCISCVAWRVYQNRKRIKNKSQKEKWMQRDAH